MDKDKAKAFLVEYAELCKRHNIHIEGCGCCGSPFLDEGQPDLFHHITDENLIEISDEDWPKMDERKDEIVQQVLYGNA